jgi:hypothetical protein
MASSAQDRLESLVGTNIAIAKFLETESNLKELEFFSNIEMARYVVKILNQMQSIATMMRDDLIKFAPEEYTRIIGELTHSNPKVN